MRFDTYLPCDALKPYVSRLVISESDSAEPYRVLPDTNIVMGFQYRGGLSYIDHGQQIALSQSGITGLRDSFRIFQNTVGTGTVLVFFREGGATPFFNVPLHELFEQSISLDNFMLRSGLLVIEERLAAAGTDAERIAVIELFLLSRLRPWVASPLVAAAIALIYQSRGVIKIRDLSVQLHTSQSPLEKKFRSIVGTTPKKFASIVRFKHLMSSHNAGHSLSDTGYEAGFYDQSHFIREFKRFTGETPESFRWK